MTLRRRLEALNTRFNALVQNRLRNEDEDNNLSTQHNTIDRLRMFQSNIPNEVSATTRRRAARQSIIRISFIENSGEHLITTQRTTVKKLVVPFSMDERAFHQKIREAFPIIGEGEIEICRVDRRRRVIPVELSSVCPAAIKACPEFGRSAVYVRLKNTSSSAGTQHESSNEVNCQSSTTNTSSSAGTQHESSTTDPICGTVEIAANPGTSSRDHQWHQFESLEQRRRPKIAERRARVCQIVGPEQGIAIQFQYPDGTRKTRKFIESQPIQDLFAFAGSDDMASEVFRVQLSWSSNTILSTVDGNLLDHEISRPSTLYVLWMSGVQIEGLIASSVESSTDQPAATPDLGSIPSPIHSSDQDVGYSNTVAGNTFFFFLLFCKM
ncbi:uncharacterized protein LOC125244620 [Megalobrama amblycephala]|uniref:uncharacterized protein LOC125244620 n=1 Tax=Megalobrama amblycephala TaxID=75352 RepID=UPI0020143CDE|nr:uncharacterized protein LOC125244620 [Megalobrama amblycephala]